MKEKVKEFLINNLNWIILFICVVSFLALAETVFSKEFLYIDVIGRKFVSTSLISNFATPIAKFVTNFGGTVWLVSVSAILLLLIKNRKIGISIFSNLAIAAGINSLLKNILQRPRPSGYMLIDESGYSFPSGHSMVSMAFYGFIIFLIYKYVENKCVKWLLISLLCVLIFAIGVSRIYLGVHYTSDVLAGFLVAISYLVVYVGAFNKFIKI